MIAPVAPKLCGDVNDDNRATATAEKMEASDTRARADGQ